ncbi:MAG TPA: nucleotide exchange factor GrpE [Patescibacteria group bacterium]|nr:nucleotide exchange factor GrpE [Patescibacteria group bacterium]
MTDIVDNEPKMNKEENPEKKPRLFHRGEDNKKLKEELAEAQNGWLRARADYANLQKEVAENQGRWRQQIEERILTDFTPVYDNLKKAFLSQPEANGDNWVGWAKGMECIKKQFGDVLASYGVKEQETVGQIFSPAQHEAVGEEESEAEEGTILQEIDPGYQRAGQVIKPARVIVAKKKSDNLNPSSTSNGGEEVE